MNKAKTALVTGGAGFIGSHLTDFLLDQGISVICLDNLSSGSLKNLDRRSDFVEGSITDLDLCNKLVKEVDYVFHLAAMSRSGPSEDQFALCHSTNVVGTFNLLEACRFSSVEKFVYSASSTCYGNAAAPQGLDSPIDLLNYYGWSKYSGEQLALMYAKSSKVPTISLRYFNVYGKGQPEVGEYALVLGIFLNQFAKDEPLEIHGGGNQKRDFIHVDDVVRCNLLAAQSSLVGFAYNVGQGENLSIKALADLISDKQIIKPRRASDAFETLASIVRTTTDLGWSPSGDLMSSLNNFIIEYKSTYGK